jgi:hypothetical protein
MTTQALAPEAPYPWAAGLPSWLGPRPLAPHHHAALARSAQARSLAAAVLPLTGVAGYAAMPDFKNAGQLSVHERAGVVTTPGSFRVCVREGQLRLQSPDGLWSELHAEPVHRPLNWRHPLTPKRVHVLLPDGTRITLQQHEARGRHRVVVSHGNKHLASDSALPGPVWQPVQRNTQSAFFWDFHQEGARYKAMIDEGLLPRSQLPWQMRALERLTASAALFLEAYAAEPQRWERLYEAFRAHQSLPHLPVVSALGDRECLPHVSGGPGGAAALWGHDVPFDLPSRFAQMRNAVAELLLLILKPAHYRSRSSLP